MVTILELELPTEEFALDKTLTTVSEVHIEIERVVADDPDRITPYLWVRTDDFDSFEVALEDDPTILINGGEGRISEQPIHPSLNRVSRTAVTGSAPMSGTDRALCHRQRSTDEYPCCDAQVDPVQG